MSVLIFYFIKFIYSEKATKFCEISSLLLTGTTYDKSKVEIICGLLRIYKLYTRQSETSKVHSV